MTASLARMFRGSGCVDDFMNDVEMFESITVLSKVIAKGKIHKKRHNQNKISEISDFLIKS